MSEYRGDLLYFIKLYDSFINGDVVRWIEKQEHGDTIIVLLLRLMLIAKNRKGKLARIVGEMEDPYTIKEMAIETFKDEETVKKGIETLIKAGLIIVEDGVYILPKALEFTNQTTLGAVKKQEYRRQKADKCLTDIEEEIELEKENRKKNTEEEIQIIEKENDVCKEIIQYLNNKLNSKYSEKNQETIELIKQNLKIGYTVEDFKNVIDKKYNDWNGTNMQKYLRPETLFGYKFEGYVNQKSKNSQMDTIDFDSLYAN